MAPLSPACPAFAAALDLAPGERWHVATTQPQKERLAAAQLANQGFRCFLPQQLTTRRHARQFRTALQPVFPRYLFLILDPRRDRWRSVNGTLGVQALLCAQGAPSPVRMGVVETLIASTDAAQGLTYARERAAPGERVRLIAGPFAGAFGELQSLDAAGRVRLLLQVLGGAVALSAPRREVEAAS